MDSIILKDVTKTYSIGKIQNGVAALGGINLSVPENEVLAIVGPSGSGKSTLLHIIGCLDSYTTGNYTLFGEEICYSNNKEMAKLRNTRFGFVLQQYGLILQKSVVDNVALPLLFSSEKYGNIEKKTDEILKRFSIFHLKNKKVKFLSGGEKQRVAIARALVNDPDIILADEPTGALDSQTGSLIIDSIISLKARGKTIILVTHDTSIAEKCDRTIMIKDGVVS
jgi:ABC-type antimicrobial peptide transport system, ATPase component